MQSPRLSAQSLAQIVQQKTVSLQIPLSRHDLGAIKIVLLGAVVSSNVPQMLSAQLSE
jgi:hypothetical protein